MSYYKNPRARQWAANRQSLAPFIALAAQSQALSPCLAVGALARVPSGVPSSRSTPTVPPCGGVKTTTCPKTGIHQTCHATSFWRQGGGRILTQLTGIIMATSHEEIVDPGPGESEDSALPCCGGFGPSPQWGSIQQGRTTPKLVSFLREQRTCFTQRLNVTATQDPEQKHLLA